MKRRSYIYVALAIVAVSAFSLATHAQNPAPAQAVPQPYNTGLGDLMNTFVQPRHVKLGLAARNENWPLADYALHELKQSLTKVGQSRPLFRKLSVPELIEASTADPIRTMEQAIKSRDLRQFNEGYGKLTAGCNSCHAATNHDFVVIVAPEQSTFSNQDFLAAR